MAILVFDNICKTFGNHKANDHISFEIPENTIFGLLGPNGAGKTTLIRIITNILTADSGKIMFRNEPFRPEHHVNIGYMPEERGLYKKMKVGEQLLYLARLKGLSKKEGKEKIRFWMDKFNIADWWDKKIEELSKGMQQKIQFIATVVHDPDLVILDEPFSGLDPINANLIRSEIFEMRERGASVIFSTHRMEQVEEICEEIALINQGKNILNGPVADIKQQFKENKYSVEFDGELPVEVRQQLNIIEERPGFALLQLQSEEESSGVLKMLLNSPIRIKSFNEILPSINEIFISQVEQMEGEKPEVAHA